MFTYKMLLRFAFPSTTAPKSFKDKELDFTDAALKFNEKFLGKKTIEIVELNSVAYINLITEVAVSNPTRETSAFSRILKYDFNWKGYSQVENRMFDVTLLEETNSVKETENIKISLPSSRLTIQEILEISDLDVIGNIVDDLKLMLKISEAQKVIIEAQELTFN